MLCPSRFGVAHSTSKPFVDGGDGSGRSGAGGSSGSPSARDRGVKWRKRSTCWRFGASACRGTTGICGASGSAFGRLCVCTKRAASARIAAGGAESAVQTCGITAGREGRQKKGRLRIAGAGAAARARGRPRQALFLRRSAGARVFAGYSDQVRGCARDGGRAHGAADPAGARGAPPAVAGAGGRRGRHLVARCAGPERAGRRRHAQGHVRPAEGLCIVRRRLEVS